MVRTWDVRWLLGRGGGTWTPVNEKDSQQNSSTHQGCESRIVEWCSKRKQIMQHRHDMFATTCARRKNVYNQLIVAMKHHVPRGE